jgi:signal transduction histidine kinase
MRVPRLRTIRARLVIACVMLVFAPLAAVWSLGWYDALDERSEAASLAELSAEVLADLDRFEPSEFAARERVYVRRLDRDGNVVAASASRHGDGRAIEGELQVVADFFFGPEGAPSLDEVEREAGALANRPEVRAALAGEPSDAQRRTASGALVVSYRVVPLPDGALVLARGSRRSARSLYDSRYQLLKLSLALCFGAVLVGGWLAWTVVGPIAALRRQLEGHRDAGDGGPLHARRDDEIGALAADFEALRRQLADKLADTTRAAADLAHELKSPVAAVATAAELVEQTEEWTHERRLRIATALADVATRMSSTLASVLVLAELDESLFGAMRQPVDLVAIAREVVAANKGGARELVLEVGGAPPRVLGVPDRLQEALRTLVDNAMVFAESRITLEVVADASWVVASVTDDGPGVSAGDRERIFSRFFSARPEGVAKGTGLGLSIARSIAAAHGGTLVLAAAERERGARFELRLPRPDEP